MSDQPTRARDEDGKIIKNREPDPKEMIDPFQYKYMDKAVNYDRRWVGTQKLGDTIGYWATTPFKRVPETEELYNKLKAQGIITWEEKAFLFTHEMGVMARKHYEQRVLKGELKANKKSWGNKHEALTGVSFEELEKKYPELYKRTTATYIKVSDKLAMINDAMKKHRIKLSELEEGLELIAEETGFPADEVRKIVVGKMKKDEEESSTAKSDEEIESVGEPAAFDFDSAEPSDSEILAESTPDIEAETEDLEEDEEEVDLEAIAHEAKEEKIQEIEAEKEAVAASAIAEPTLDFEMSETITQSTEIPTSEPEKVIEARVFEDSSKEKIHTDCEAVTWKSTEDKTDHVAYLVEVPGYREMWLEPGLNLVGNHENGQLYLIKVIVGKSE